MIRYSTFPRTEPPPSWATEIVNIFKRHEEAIGTEGLARGLDSDQVLSYLTPDLQALGFQLEMGKHKTDKIERPVFYGENGIPTVRYQVDGYHSQWRCGLEVEAGRAWMGNAVYRDFIQALVMVDVDWLCLAVSNEYKYKAGGREAISPDYQNTLRLADAIFGHNRVQMPYRLLLIGY